MPKPLERRQLKATQVFDLEDAFARARRVRGLHPRPFGEIRFYNVARIADGGTPEYWSQPLALRTVLNPSGYHLFFNDYLLADGSKRANFLTEGDYLIRIEAQYYQPVERSVTLPMPDPKQPEFFDLVPGYAYPFPFPVLNGHGLTLLYGKVQNADGAGLARVVVTVDGEAISYETDQAGQWVLVFPNDWETGSVTLRFMLPDGSSQTLADVLVNQGEINSVPAVTVPVN
jgi:hypothetical protein